MSWLRKKAPAGSAPSHRKYTVYGESRSSQCSDRSLHLLRLGKYSRRASRVAGDILCGIAVPGADPLAVAVERQAGLLGNHSAIPPVRWALMDI